MMNHEKGGKEGFIRQMSTNDQTGSLGIEENPLGSSSRKHG